MSLPVALDTNVLVRLLVNDDPAQAEQAAALIAASAACIVTITVALELELCAWGLQVAS
jgi:predicted nucleic acid-binding protein